MLKAGVTEFKTKVCLILDMDTIKHMLTYFCAMALYGLGGGVVAYIGLHFYVERDLTDIISLGVFGVLILVGALFGFNEARKGEFWQDLFGGILNNIFY
jgi:hypothetical protein